MKKSIPVSFLFFILLMISYSCYRENDPDEILDRYCSFYRPDYSTIEVCLEYKYFGFDSSSQLAVIKIFNWSPDGKLTVNDLDGGKLTINGYETEFKDSLGVEGFYPKDDAFYLQPDKRYSIVFEHDSSTYESEVLVPSKLDNLVDADEINMVSDLRLQFNTPNNHFAETTIYLRVYNPENPSDSLLLIKNELYSGGEITIPLKVMASALYGWEAELYVRRINEGYYDPAFLNDSKVTGTSSYYKKFKLTYSDK